MLATVFLFHRVNSQKDRMWPPMPPERFRNIVEYIHRNYCVIKLEEYFLSERPAFKKPVAMIVFDDGYKDYLDVALPVLRKYQCPSSMYVVIDSIEKGLPPWTYVMDHAISTTRKLTIDCDMDQLPEKLKVKGWNTPEERLDYGFKLKQFLKSAPDHIRKKVYQCVVENFDDVMMPTDLMMTWNDVQNLHREGCGIGSHTMSHPLLGKIQDEQGIRYELQTSYEVLKNKLGASPIAVSYPNGSYDERVMRIAQQSGYKLGLAVNQRMYQVNDSLFEIPRIDMYEGQWWKLKLAMRKLKQQMLTW